LALGIVVVRRNSGIRPKQAQQQVRPVHGVDNDNDDDLSVILSSTTLWPLSERVRKSYNEWSAPLDTGHVQVRTASLFVISFRWKFPNRFTPARTPATSRAREGTQIVSMLLLPLLNTDETTRPFPIVRENPADVLAYVCTSPSWLRGTVRIAVDAMASTVPKGSRTREGRTVEDGCRRRGINYADHNNCRFECLTATGLPPLPGCPRFIYSY
jgi:hypothetical protein